MGARNEGRYHASHGGSGSSEACRNAAIRSLLGEKRTWRDRRKSVVHGPSATSALQYRCAAQGGSHVPAGVVECDFQC